MSEGSALAARSRLVHWSAVALLFLMMAQPTMDNALALLNGAFVKGDLRVEATFANMFFQGVGTVMGWLGFVWFVQRQKRGAYLGIMAHMVGLGAAVVQLPELVFSTMSPPVIVSLLAVIVAVSLGPIFAFQDEYT